MIQASSLYQLCCEIFVDYPLAVDSCDDEFRSMVLMVLEGDNARFFILSCDSSESTPCFSLRPWRARGTVRIDANDSRFPDTAVRAVRCGIPIPRDGSLFGCKAGGAITAMITVYAGDSPESLQPSWAVMPLVGVPEVQWPPFAGEHFLGRWFWEHYHSQTIVSLDTLIGMVPDTVFWVDTKAVLGWDTGVVARDIKSHDGYTLRQGRYVYHQALRMRKSVPTLDSLLASGDKIDLAFRFQPCVPSES